MTHEEIRVRLIEIAARTPNHHVDGHAAGVLEAAKVWEPWVLGEAKPAETKGKLGLPKSLR
jgi:hypothetical protein